MTEVEFSLIIWGIITVISVILAFLFHYYFTKYNNGVGGFENRKKEIAVGMVVCVLAISSFMFIPVLFSQLHLKDACASLWDSISFAEAEAEDNGQKLNLAPFIKSFAYIVTAMALKLFKFLYWFVPAICSALVVFFVIKILFTIREPEDKSKEKYKRKHIFEYHENIIEEINKNIQR